MMKKFYALYFTLVILSSNAISQNVGINATGAAPNASAMLDVDATNKGLLIPRVALTSTTSNAPIGAGIANSLLVYNTATAGTAPNNVTPGYYYWDGTSWVRLLNNTGNNGTAWLTTGNAGTTVGTNYLGTSDNTSLSISTNGTERMRVLNTGLVGINTTTPARMLDVVWNTTTADNSTIRGQATGNARVYGVHGIVTSSTTTNASGVRGDAPATTGSINGVLGVSASADGNGVFGFNSQATSYNTVGVLGAAARGTGVYGIVSGADGWGVWGQADVNNGVGVIGSSNNATGFGLEGINTNASGTGIIASGNNTIGSYLVGGSGGSFTGSTYGIAAFKNGNLANNTGAGYFIASTTSNVGVAVAYRQGATNYKIIDIGAFGGNVSTDVWDTDNKTRRIMFAPEAPEIFFQDFGRGQLVNGKAHIELDPIFSRNIVVNEQHPLNVFIQLEGDCNGVYVTNKTQNGFDVIELNNGTSNVKFSYFVNANRADYIHPETNELISKHEGVRFPIAPEPLPFKTLENNDKVMKEKLNRKIHSVETIKP